MSLNIVVQFLFVFTVCYQFVGISAGSLKKDELMRAFSQKCNEGFSMKCLKVDFVEFLDKMDTKEDIDLFSGISLAKDSSADISKPSEIIADISRSYNDPNDRLNAFVATKISNFFKSHHLKFSLFNAENETEAEVGRKGKIGKKGGLEAILAAGMMMKGTLMAIGIGAVALMAGKALMTGVIALVLSAIVGLKNMSGGGKSTTYEIVAKPIYTSSHTHSHSMGQEEHHHSGGSGGGGSGYGGGHGSYRRSIDIQLPEHLKSQIH